MKNPTSRAVALCAPPLGPSGIYRVWGGALVRSLPLRSLAQGYGTAEVEEKYWLDFSSRHMHKKGRLRFDLAWYSTHLCDSTVAVPPLPFPARALRGCGGKWGAGWTTPGGISKGATLFCRPTPEVLGGLNTIVMMNLMGGGGCLGHLPPCLVTHALCMHQDIKEQRLTDHAAAPPPLPPKKTYKPRTRRSAGRG